MSRPYDDQRYLQVRVELSKLIFEYLDTEGNTEANLRNELDEIIAEAKDNL